MLHILSGLSMGHQQVDPSKMWMLSPWGKGDVPRRCFPNRNLGWECCAALLSALCWESGPTDLIRGCSIGNQSKAHLLILGLPRMPLNCHSCANDWVHSDHQSQTSASTNKAWQSLLSGTSIFMGWKHSQQLPKQTNVIRTEASSINTTRSWKNSKLKHVVPVGWVFLANPLRECT